MSNRKLMTAKELKITPQEREALLRVREKLASGKIVHEHDACGDQPRFNMETAWEHGECGYVGCIGGWMGLEMGLGEVEDYVGSQGEPGDGVECRSTSLDRLFYPPDHKEFSCLTTKQAVRAIDRFMTGSKYPWGI